MAKRRSRVSRTRFQICRRNSLGILTNRGIKRANIAGISLGGLIAQHFAAHYPGSVEKLVLIDTTPRYTDELRAMWVERAATARRQGVASMVPGLLKIWFSDACLARDPPGVRYVRETLQKTSGEGYALACEALGAADLRDDAARITAPTLVMCGENDIPSFLRVPRAGLPATSRVRSLHGCRRLAMHR